MSGGESGEAHGSKAGCGSPNLCQPAVKATSGHEVVTAGSDSKDVCGSDVKHGSETHESSCKLVHNQSCGISAPNSSCESSNRSPGTLKTQGREYDRKSRDDDTKFINCPLVDTPGQVDDDQVTTTTTTTTTVTNVAMTTIPRDLSITTTATVGDGPHQPSPEQPTIQQQEWQPLLT